MRIILLAVLLVACGGSGGGGSNPSPLPVPVVTPSLPYPDAILGLVTHQLTSEAIDSIDDLGIRHVRFTIYWHSWHEEAYRRSIIEQLDDARNFDLLLVLHGDGDDLEGYLNFVRDIHTLSPQSALQIWNEVDSRTGPGNGWKFFGGNPQMYVSHLADVRSAVLDAKLVSAGLASSGDELARWISALSGSVADVIAVHTYGWPLAGSYRAKAAPATKPIWNTEFGMEEAVLPPWEKHRWPGDQRIQIAESVEALGLYERSYLFVLNDGENAGHTITPETAQWLRRRMIEAPQP